MPFADVTAVITYINSNIVTNGAQTITGAIMNEALIGMLQFVYEEKTLVETLSSAGTTITNTLLIGAEKLKIYSSVRLTDNDTVGSPVPDGFTFNNTTGTITFASTRASGEIFTIDYLTQS